MAFKILYHEDALADLEEIFVWSREKHPATTEQFANDLFAHIELLHLHRNSNKVGIRNQQELESRPRIRSK